MIPTNDHDIEVTGNLSGKKIAMRISADATVHLMSVLTNLYENRILAMIREYSTNAWDANVERWGKSAPPIHVTTPTGINPYLIITDAGFGISETDLEEVYSQYGESTKRGSNEYNGMLGIGAKSALAYTPSFTIESVHKGTKVTVSVSLDVEGVGEMDIVDVRSTDQDSGTVIKIPIKKDDIYRVGNEANNFYGFWNDGTVILNGRRAKRHEFVRVTDKIFSCDNVSEDTIVMGNVPYPIPGERKSLDNLPSMVYFAEIGEVKPTPSREALIANARTMNVVEKALDEYEAEFVESLSKKLSEMTKAEAWMNSIQYNKRYFPKKYREFTWKGEKIPPAPVDRDCRLYLGEGSTVDNSTVPIFHRVFNGWGSKSESYTNSVVNNSVIVQGAPANMTPTNRKRLREASKEKHSDVLDPTFYLTTQDTLSTWTNGVKTITWREVLKHDAAQPKAIKSLGGKYVMYDLNGYEHEQTVVTGKKYLYISPADVPNKSMHAMSRYWLYKYPEYDFLISTPRNRHEKLKRLADAHPLTTLIDNHSRIWFSCLPKKVRKAYFISSANGGLKKLLTKSPSAFDCPATASIVASYDDGLAAKAWEEYNGLRHVGGYGRFPDNADTEQYKLFPDSHRELSRVYALDADTLIEIGNALFHYRRKAEKEENVSSI